METEQTTIRVDASRIGQNDEEEMQSRAQTCRSQRAPETPMLDANVQTRPLANARQETALTH